MREIALTQGQVALCDDCDYEMLNQFKWFAQNSRGKFYAHRNSHTTYGKRHGIYMHREIIGTPLRGFEIDHVNGCGTDNRRENLRFVTHRQNGQNLKSVKKTSKYAGVSWYKPTQKWVAMININGKTKNLGYSTDEKEAFGFYKQAVKNRGEKMLGEK